jgi:pSer/pThr/pTyr-binding forkhead associated (FHA) protein
MQVHLVPVAGGESLSLNKTITVVGRKEGCDLRLNHKSISKQHCVLVKVDGLLLLRDLGSTNGTRLNGKRIRRAAITNNDQLGVAGLNFKVQFGETPAPQPLKMNDATQHIDAAEVEKLVKKRTDPHGSLAGKPLVPLVKVNSLPDEFTAVPDDQADKGD